MIGGSAPALMRSAYEADAGDEHLEVSAKGRRRRRRRKGYVMTKAMRADCRSKKTRLEALKTQ